MQSQLLNLRRGLQSITNGADQQPWSCSQDGMQVFPGSHSLGFSADRQPSALGGSSRTGPHPAAGLLCIHPAQLSLLEAAAGGWHMAVADLRS